MKNNRKRRLSLFLSALLLLVGGISSCNSSSDPVEEIAVTISTVAVKDFSIKADSKIMAGLDTVFFSIDLNNGVIFNADSLPKGTDITRLIPQITFANAMSEAKIIMKKEGEKTDTVNYLTNSTDSIDFSKEVHLDVTSYDGQGKYSYLLKVNVHKMVGDSLMWDKMERTPFPSVSGRPINQKSVTKGNGACTLIEEQDGSYTWAECGSLQNPEWISKSLELTFVPEVRSLTASGDLFWILDTDGNLYNSPDGATWDATGEKWITLIGGYQKHVLGVKDVDGALMHCHYPSSDLIKDSEMSEDFPIYSRSELYTLESQWTDEPTAIFIGGVTASGEVSSHTWGFDGTSWCVIDSQSTAPLKGASLFHYVVYRRTSSSFKQIETDVWVALGGQLADGSYNRTVYLSYDNGVTWMAAKGTMRLPESFPRLYDADAIVSESKLNADIADSWQKTRLSYELDGTEITWGCPFIYILGGVTADGTLSDEVWRGILARLAFTPII